MMKDIEIKISRETRMVDLSKTTIGNDGENLQGNLVFSFTDDFVKGQGRLEYVINGESKYAFLLSDDENYYIPIKSVMTKEGQIDMQLVITEGTDANEIPIFKSNVFYVSCKKSINAEVEEEEEYYSWIEIANTKLNEIDEVVKNVETKLANGEFDGKDGIDGKDGKDFTYEDFTEEQLENLRGPQGIPGEPGADGKDYVLTEADKEEIADNINEENNNRITENEKYISELEATIDILTNTDKKRGELVHITDALPLPTFENKIDGNVKQETTEGTNEFNAYAIANAKIVVSEDGKIITMPLIESGNGIVSTNKKLGELCPNLKVGDVIYLYFDRNLTSHNTFIYLLESNYIWYRNTSRTITETDLDSEVNLYGNRVQDGETGQVILTDFQITKVQNALWEKFTNGASPNPDYPQEIEVLEGYNKLKITTFTDGSKEQIKNGVTATINDDGTITCKGTATDAITFYLTKNDLDFTLGDGYFLCNSPSANQRVEFVCSTDGTEKYLNSYGTGNFINSKTSFVFKSAYILIAKGENVDVTFKPMFAKGTEQKPYLPYGCVGYKVNGKNLLSANDLKPITKNGITFTPIYKENGTLDYVNVNGTATADINYVVHTETRYPINKEKSYFFSGCPSGGSLSTYHFIIYYYDENEGYLGGVYDVGVGKEIPKSSYILANIFVTSGITMNNAKFYPMLRLASDTDDEYTPYKEQIVYLDLKGNWVGKIDDNIKDYLVTDKKKLWLVKNVDKDFLTDTNVSKQIKEYNNLWWVGIKKPSNSKMFNNWEKHKMVVNCAFYSEIREKEQSYQTLIGNGEWGIIVNSSETIENIRPKILGGYYYYQLATPQIIELGELPEPIKTFEGTNNIQVLANLDTEIEVTYALDVKKYFENKLASIQEQIL